MVVYDYYWQSNDDWWEYDDNLHMVVREDAPQEAKESYQNYLNQKRNYRKAKEERDHNGSND